MQRGHGENERCLQVSVQCNSMVGHPQLLAQRKSQLPMYCQRFSESQYEKRREKGLVTEGGMRRRLGEREGAVAAENSIR